jgi:general secretion pathway protein G
MAHDDRGPLIVAHHRSGSRRGGLFLRGRVRSVDSRKRNPAAHKPVFGLPSSVHRNHSCRNSKSLGFTVLELLIVVAVLLTISAIAIPNLMAAVDLARIARAVGDIKTLEDEIALYDLINDKLPDDLSQVGYGNYLDPWHNPYQYLNHATMKGNGQARKDRFLVPLNSDYDLYSMGKDGLSVAPITAKTSQDDIIRASAGSYLGLASQF